tara:strand:+ start:1122 stop:1487 length:366 start_codon:yes stop_codon:yes gene_type:complete
MKPAKDEDKKELVKKIYKIINRVNIELNFKTKAETMVSQSQILANDICKRNEFKTITIQMIDDAFYEGVREVSEKRFMDIPTYFRWLRAHKKRVNEAISLVEYIGKNPKEVQYYYKQKLIK